jgi:hypothetical protein
MGPIRNPNWSTSGMMSVTIETSLGDITIDLYTDERPKCKYTGGILMGVSFFLFYVDTIRNVVENFTGNVYESLNLKQYRRKH